jgi:hypothetical protein
MIYAAWSGLLAGVSRRVTNVLLERLLVEGLVGDRETGWNGGQIFYPIGAPYGESIAVPSDRESGCAHFESSGIPPILPDKTLKSQGPEGFLNMF